ncbi:hypothetical protein GCM10028794_09360 [Silanimonas algicola]
MDWIAMSAAAVLALAALLAGFMELGFRLGRRARARDGATAEGGLGVIEGAVFALLGLLIAFTFSGAAERFNERRALIAAEANAIGTAFLRLDLLPSAGQADLRAGFLRYVDERIDTTRHGDQDPNAFGAETRTQALQAELWRQSVAAVQASGQPALAAVVLGPINDMIDLTTTRRMERMMHPHPVVFIALVLAAVLSALLAGHARGLVGGRSPLHAAVFVLVIGGTVYAILELEYPRFGVVRIDSADVVLLELREQMAAPAPAR